MHERRISVQSDRLGHGQTIGPRVSQLVTKSRPFVLGSGSELSKTALFAALQFGGWLIAGVVVFTWGMSVSGPLVAGLDEFIWIVSGLALTYGFRSIYRSARASGAPYALIGLVALFVSGAGAVVWYDCYVVLDRAGFGALARWPNLGTDLAATALAMASQPWTIPIRTWITCGCLLLTWSSLYFAINAILDSEIDRERATRAVKLADRARLSALQTQLNPHFLFNVLNGIGALIRDNDRVAAIAMVDELGDFLRSILQKFDTPEITVAEELALINQYLQLQRRRFGHRLRATVSAKPDILNARVPTLILQPLVENALQHGILALKEGGSVQISIHRRDGQLLLSVDDDGEGHSAAPHATGLGLRNCADRLLAMYGAEANLTAGAGPHGRGFAVTINLPYRCGPETASTMQPVAEFS